MRDKNEREIVDALRKAGATVTQLNEKGVPDLLVGYAGRTYLLEVKVPEAVRGPRGGVALRGGGGGDGILTAAQVVWFSAWKGGAPVVVRSPDEALAAIGAQVGPS
jgi:hypothetical protein